MLDMLCASVQQVEGCKSPPPPLAHHSCPLFRQPTYSSSPRPLTHRSRPPTTRQGHLLGLPPRLLSPGGLPALTTSHCRGRLHPATTTTFMTPPNIHLLCLTSLVASPLSTSPAKPDQHLPPLQTNPTKPCRTQLPTAHHTHSPEN